MTERLLFVRFIPDQIPKFFGCIVGIYFRRELSLLKRSRVLTVPFVFKESHRDSWSN